jgi:plasmid maintenance system killer protein
MPAPQFPGAASNPRSSDARAMEVADRVMTSLGGREAWDRTHFLRFSFGQEREGKFQGRTHYWDKWTGRYRVQGMTREGQPYVILMNLNSKDGRAWLAGKELSGDELKKQLERGYGMWVNDTYWLLMPYKMKDPGVVLTYAGEERGESGALYDKLNLRFESVGLTPKDTYWVWVNRDTGMVDRWDYVLNGESVPPTTWQWVGWKKYGDIMLAGERVNAKENRKLMLPDIAVMETVPDAVFTSPDPVR